MISDLSIYICITCVSWILVKKLQLKFYILLNILLWEIYTFVHNHPTKKKHKYDFIDVLIYLKFYLWLHVQDIRIKSDIA